MGLIDSADIVYFANLSDIWSFAANRNRGTGTRFEGGVIPSITYLNQEDNFFNPNDQSPIYQYEKTIDYGLYGFLSYNRFKAISYSWQSDIFIDLTFGRSYTDQSYVERSEDNNFDISEYHESWNGILNLSWQIGYMPNTRTSLTLTPFTSVSYGISQSDHIKEKTGINTGFSFSSYYYISPRFRVQVSANFTYSDNFSYKSPSPFWNAINYNSDFRYGKTNDVVANQQKNNFPSPNRLNGYNYNFQFAITYALF